MTSQEQHIDISFKARFYTWGKLNADTKTIWFVLHGYGQLAKYFIKKFEALDPEKNLIVAPEGLSKFYLQGFEGRVGATWMTRENRLTDINNYLNFLNTLQNSIMETAPKAIINVLGFSQGAATACRWIVDSNINFNQLVLWAGIFPPDLNINEAQRSLKDKRVTVVIGSEDPFLSDERIKEMEKISMELNVKPEVLRYAGAHAIDTPTFLKLATSS